MQGKTILLRTAINTLAVVAVAAVLVASVMAARLNTLATQSRELDEQREARVDRKIAGWRAELRRPLRLRDGRSEDDRVTEGGSPPAGADEPPRQQPEDDRGR